MSDGNGGGGTGGAGAAGGQSGAGAAPGALPTPSPGILPGVGGAGGAKGGNEFLATLPEELRSDPSLQSIKDLPSLAKSFVHAQKLVGADKVVLPKDDSKPEEWEAIYNKLGRPEKPEEYKFSDVKLPEGFELDAKLHDRFKPVLHKLGLSNKQADGVRSEFMQYQIETITAEIKAQNEAVAAGEKALRDKWGANYDENAKKAGLAIAKFASPELLKKLEKTGLGSDPGLVEAFYEIGSRMSEDKGTGASGGRDAGGVESARAEVAALTKDVEFQKALQDRWHKDHAEAVKKWESAHRRASPPQQ